MHLPSEIGIDSFQADRSPDHRYRTAPLKGLWTHTKGGFFHDGRFATLREVIDHYDGHFHLGLSEGEKGDLEQYLLSLGDAPVSVKHGGGDDDDDDEQLRAMGDIRLASPNPSTAGVTVEFNLPRASHVDAAVYNVAGRKVASLADGQPFEPGPHRLSWDGRTSSGAAAANGIYFVRVVRDGTTWSRTITLVR
jgi:hypothetical protein